MKDEFYKFNDSGHGWLQVTRTDLTKLGIEKSISPFSYQNDEFVYLEEDSDMGTFLKAYQTVVGAEPTIFDTYVAAESEIRKYESYTI